MTRRWTDGNGVLRCDRYERSDTAPACSIIIERGQVAGAVMGGECSVLVAAPPGHVTPLHVRIVREGTRP